MDYIIQLVTAFLGSLGFSLLFRVSKDKLLRASFGGLISWGIYLIMGIWIKEEPLLYLIASSAITIYAEILARKTKTPTTIYIVSAAIPLMPGGSLYDTMRAVVQQNMSGFFSNAKHTLLLAGAIALGIISTMSIIQAIYRMYDEIQLKYKKRKK